MHTGPRFYRDSLRIFYLKFSQFQVYLNVTQAKQMTSLLLLNSFYPMISHRRAQTKKKATNYCIWFGHSLWSANQLPSARGLKERSTNFTRPEERILRTRRGRIIFNLHRWRVFASFVGRLAGATSFQRENRNFPVGARARSACYAGNNGDRSALSGATLFRKFSL